MFGIQLKQFNVFNSNGKNNRIIQKRIENLDKFDDFVV